MTNIKLCCKCKEVPRKSQSYCEKCQKNYGKTYRAKNKQKRNEYLKKYYENGGKQKIAKYHKLYAKNQKEKISTYHKQYNFKKREKVINHYGGKCACCGEIRMEFLALDHVKGGGRKHRNSLTICVYRWAILNRFPEIFRVLCHNCNSSKAYYGYCPHDIMRNIMPTELCKVPIEEKK